jgi:diaminohydroxyphosphoribosylaminopyrimidine deaminase / 5-amino-6-(5-phosphoribosylamino)uracil reductase
MVALAEAGDRAYGATAVVTLEPCARHAGAPPCTSALLAAGISAVRYAVPDPNPATAGGERVLRAAGVNVRGGPLSEEVRTGPLRAWLHFMATGRPHVTWKYAMTLDGRVAAADGTSGGINGPAVRAEVHALRTRVDAIMIGRGTVVADNPGLLARDAEGDLPDRQPLRVVVATGDLPPDAKLADPGTLHLRTHDPAAVLTALAAREVVDVLLEGSPTLAGAFLHAGLIDRILAFVAPMLLGSGASALAGAGVSTITDAYRFTIDGVTMNGSDVRISAVPVRAG